MTSQALNRPVGQTVRAKRAIHAYIEHGAQADVLARGQIKRDADSAIADFQAARLRYEERQPEPCQFCAVEDEADEYPLPLFFAFCIGALGLWGATAYATWWLVGTFLGVKA